MMIQQYDIAYAGAEMPKGRYQKLALPMYNDSGKKFDPLEAPKRWLKPLGPPLRKVYLWVFWNDICKVIYKDCYWTVIRVNEWNGNPEMEEDQPAKWLATCAPCNHCLNGFRACVGGICAYCGDIPKCKSALEKTTSCVKTLGDPTCCVIEDGKLTGVPNCKPDLSINCYVGSGDNKKPCCGSSTVQDSLEPTEFEDEEAKEAYETERAKKLASIKVQEAQKRAAVAVMAAEEKAKLSELQETGEIKKTREVGEIVEEDIVEEEEEEEQNDETYL